MGLLMASSVSHSWALESLSAMLCVPASPMGQLPGWPPQSTVWSWIGVSFIGDTPGILSLSGHPSVEWWHYLWSSVQLTRCVCRTELLLSQNVCLERVNDRKQMIVTGQEKVGICFRFPFLRWNMRVSLYFLLTLIGLQRQVKKCWCIGEMCAHGLPHSSTL